MKNKRKPPRKNRPLVQQQETSMPITFPPSGAAAACDFARDQYWDGATRRFFDWSNNAPVLDAWDTTINYAVVARPCGLLPGRLGTDTFTGGFKDALTDEAGFTVVMYVLFNDVSAIQNILAVFNDVPGSAHRRLKLISGQLRAWQFDGGTNNVDLTSVQPFTANVVHRIAATFTPTETSLQFDNHTVQTIGGVAVPDTLNRADPGNADSSEAMRGAILGIVVYPPQPASSLAALDPLEL